MRTGLWSKHRTSQRGEFVIGGHIPSHLGLESIVVGFYRGEDFTTQQESAPGLYRSHVVRCSRRRSAANREVPFVNLPEKDEGRWGQRLTGEKMKECVW